MEWLAGIAVTIAALLLITNLILWGVAPLLVLTLSVIGVCALLYPGNREFLRTRLEIETQGIYLGIIAVMAIVPLLAILGIIFVAHLDDINEFINRKF